MSFQAMYRVGGVQKSAGTYPDRKLAETAYYEAMPNVRRGIDPSKPERRFQDLPTASSSSPGGPSRTGSQAVLTLRVSGPNH